MYTLLVEIQILLDYRGDVFGVCEEGPLADGVLIGMTLTDGYMYPVAITGITTVKLAAMTPRCASHAC